MNHELKEKLDTQVIDESDWVDYVYNCVTENICPKCGTELYQQNQSIKKNKSDPNLYICLYCGWNDYV